MTKEGFSHRWKGSILGAVLGLGAPAGSLFFRMLNAGGLDWGWIRQEIDGHFYFYAYMFFLTPLAFGLFGYYLGWLNDKISAQKKSYEALASVLKNQSMTDDVTGLYNHRHILEEAEKEIERAKRRRRALCGMMVDLDDFKLVNDVYGHWTGDIVLRQAAFLLSDSIRKIDIVGRYGGDEFLVILPETSYEAAKGVARRVQDTIRGHCFRNKVSGCLSLTASIGLFVFEDPSELDLPHFVEKADEAMFRAKQLGKDRICSFDWKGPIEEHEILVAEESG